MSIFPARLTRQMAVLVKSRRDGSAVGLCASRRMFIRVGNRIAASPAAARSRIDCAVAHSSATALAAVALCHLTGRGVAQEEMPIEPLVQNLGRDPMTEWHDKAD